jgi:hypothetical protein
MGDASDLCVFLLVWANVRAEFCVVRFHPLGTAKCFSLLSTTTTTIDCSNATLRCKSI